LKKKKHLLFGNGKSAYDNKFDLLILFIYFLFTVFFFVQRTSFLDNPFTLFKLINDDELFVNANRYPAVILQLLPMAGIKLGLPLKVLMFLQSLGYFLYHATIFFLIRNWIKDRTFSWLVLLGLTIPVMHTFFWNNNELFLGLTGLCLWMACMRKGYFVTGLLVALLIAWLHPLLLVVVLLITAGSLVTKDIKLRTLLLNITTYIISYFIKGRNFPNYYDTNKRNQLFKNMRDGDIDFNTIIDNALTLNYWPIFLSVVIVLVVLLKYKKWLLGLLLVGFSLCFLLLTNLAEIDSEYVFYNESNYRVLFFAAGLLLIFSGVLDGFKKLHYGLVPLLIAAFVRITLVSNIYTDRIFWYQELAATNDRTVYSYGKKTESKLVQSWASPFESIVLSTISGESATIVFTENISKLESEISTNRQMITNKGKFLKYNPANRYFFLKDKSYQRGHLD